VYLFIFMLTYFFLVFFLRSFLLWRKTKINPLTFNKSDDAHGYNERVFGVVSLLEFLIVFVYAFIPSWHKYLLPFWYLENVCFVWFGWMLLIISLVLVWVAQSHMRNSWRIGIDQENKSELVTGGFFAISRNPIFLGIMLANAGLFLILPNAFTLLIITLSIISINTQIRLEEVHLLKEHGEEYKTYLERVNRWLSLRLR